MSGKPFQSKLEPHYELIREARRNRQTWQAIVELLAAPRNHHQPASGLFIHEAAAEKRRYAFGMEPDVPVLPTVTELSARSEKLPETPNLSELPPPPSEFEADPLSLPPKVKAKPMWTVLKPNS